MLSCRFFPTPHPILSQAALRVAWCAVVAIGSRASVRSFIADSGHAKVAAVPASVDGGLRGAVVLRKHLGRSHVALEVRSYFDLSRFSFTFLSKLAHSRNLHIH